MIRLTAVGQRRLDAEKRCEAVTSGAAPPAVNCAPKPATVNSRLSPAAVLDPDTKSVIVLIPSFGELDTKVSAPKPPVMPECAAGFSARRDRKNDIDMMSNCQPRSRRNAASDARRSGDAVLDALAQRYRWSFPRAVAGVIGTSAPGCHGRPGAPQKNNNPVS
jgi:hypothetical protein